MTKYGMPMDGEIVHGLVEVYRERGAWYSLDGKPVRLVGWQEVEPEQPTLAEVLNANRDLRERCERLEAAVCGLLSLGISAPKWPELEEVLNQARAALSEQEDKP